MQKKKKEIELLYIFGKNVQHGNCLNHRILKFPTVA